jgi:hypothetical protein
VLEEKGFSEIVDSVWKSKEFDSEPSTMRRLVGKLKVLKHKVIGWEKLQKKLRLLELVSIEEELESLYFIKLSGRALDTDNNIKEMEGRRLNIY